jgi:cytochrome P450
MILTDSFLTEPLSFSKRLEGQPGVSLEHISAMNREVFLFTSFAAVRLAQQDAELFSSKFGSIHQGGESKSADAEPDPNDVYLTSTLLVLDAPEHRRYRALFNPIFSPGQTAKMADRISAMTDQLIDNVIERGECDFLNEIAVPLPLMMVCDLLGFDPSRQNDIKIWSDAVAHQIGYAEDSNSSERHELIRAFSRFLIAELEARRRAPGDDVISLAIGARVAGLEPLTDLEIISIVREITIAGNETTRNTLARGLALVLSQPEIVDQIISTPAVIPDVVEEIVRLCAASAAIWRITTRDTVVENHAIPAGSLVLIRMDAANRDPTVFPDPDRIVLGRPNARNHCGFGFGEHHCLGQMLARRELGIALERIFFRMQGIKLDDQKSDLGSDYNMMLRNVKKVHVTFEKGQRLH